MLNKTIGGCILAERHTSPDIWERQKPDSFFAADFFGGLCNNQSLDRERCMTIGYIIVVTRKAIANIIRQPPYKNASLMK